MKIRRMIPLVYILILVFSLSACRSIYTNAEDTVTLPTTEEQSTEAPRIMLETPSVFLPASIPTSPNPTEETTPEPSPEPTPTPRPKSSVATVKSESSNSSAMDVTIAIQVPNDSPSSAVSETQPASNTSASASIINSDKVELPYIEYDQEAVRAEFLRGMNEAKAAKGYPLAVMSSELNAVAQERADQMAAAGKAWHIGDGFSEAVGEITGGPGAYNRGYHSISHSPPLAGYTNIGIGVAIAEDRMIYYSIIGSMATE